MNCVVDDHDRSAPSPVPIPEPRTKGVSPQRLPQYDLRYSWAGERSEQGMKVLRVMNELEGERLLEGKTRMVSDDRN